MDEGCEIRGRKMRDRKDNKREKEKRFRSSEILWRWMGLLNIVNPETREIKYTTD